MRKEFDNPQALHMCCINVLQIHVFMTKQTQPDVEQNLTSQLQPHILTVLSAVLSTGMAVEAFP